MDPQEHHLRATGLKFFKQAGPIFNVATISAGSRFVCLDYHNVQRNIYLVTREWLSHEMNIINVETYETSHEVVVYIASRSLQMLV